MGALKKEAAEEVMVGEKMETKRMVAHHVNDRIKMEIVPVHPLPLLQKVKIIKMAAMIKDQILTMQHKQRRVISLELQERIILSTVWLLGVNDQGTKTLNSLLQIS